MCVCVCNPSQNTAVLSRALSANPRPYPKAGCLCGPRAPYRKPAKPVGFSRRLREPPREGRWMKTQQDSLLPNTHLAVGKWDTEHEHVREKAAELL